MGTNNSDKELAAKSGDGVARKARSLSLASFFFGSAANVVAIVTGLAMPMTTEPGILTTGSGYEWPQRVWTHTTRVVMWTGLGTMLTLTVIAVLVGLYARFLHQRLKPGQVQKADPKTLVLIPSRDLGILVGMLAPVAAFFAEMISMAIVQSGH